MISENIKEILDELPEGIQLVGAAKTRTPKEIQEAIDGGLEIVGENYVQEAEEALIRLGEKHRLDNLIGKSHEMQGVCGHQCRRRQ